MESMKGEGRGKRNKKSQAARKGEEPSGVILGGAYNRGGACPIG